MPALPHIPASTIPGEAPAVHDRIRATSSPLAGMDRSRQMTSLLALLDAAIDEAPDELFVEAAGRYFLSLLDRSFQGLISTPSDRLLLACFTKEYPGLVVSELPEQEKDAVLDSLRSSILSRYAVHVELPVLKGGGFRLLNSKPILLAFRSVIANRLTRDREKRKYSEGAKSRVPRTRRGPVTSAQIVAAAKLSTPLNDFRASAKTLHKVVKDGIFSVATDRSLLCVLIGGDSEDVISDNEGFPKNWAHFTEGIADLTSSGFSLSPQSLKVGAVESSWLAREEKRLRGIIEDPTIADSSPVSLYSIEGTILLSGQSHSGDILYRPDAVSEDTAVLERMLLGQLYAIALTALRLGVANIAVYRCASRPRILGFVFPGRGFIIAGTCI